MSEIIILQVKDQFISTESGLIDIIHDYLIGIELVKDGKMEKSEMIKIGNTLNNFVSEEVSSTNMFIVALNAEGNVIFNELEIKPINELYEVKGFDTETGMIVLKIVNEGENNNDSNLNSEQK